MNKEIEKCIHEFAKQMYQAGYEDGTKARDGERGSTYYGGYGDSLKDGYEKGLQHGQELRAEEVKCAEACGMRKGWETARKILQMTLDEVAKVFDPTWDVEHVIEVMSVSEVITRLEAWEKKQKENEKVDCNNMDCNYEDEKQEQNKKTCDTCKLNNLIDGEQYCEILEKYGECDKEDDWIPKQEQKEKNCDNCKYNNREKTSYPCAACLRKIDGRHAMWEAKEDYVRDATPEESKSVNDYIKSISEETGVTFEEKKEQAEKSCKTCKFNPPEKKWPCVDCDASIHDRYEPKQNAPEMNVESIEVGDEVKDNFGNKLLVTHVYSECRNVDTIDTDGRVERFPSECLKKTGRRYCFQELLDAMKSEKPEEG